MGSRPVLIGFRIVKQTYVHMYTVGRFLNNSALLSLHTRCQDNCPSLWMWAKLKSWLWTSGRDRTCTYTPLMISGTPVERVSSFKYLGVNISEDLTWTAHIQTQVKKARQRLYHLQQLRKFRVSPAILKTFYSGAIESVLTQCISVTTPIGTLYIEKVLDLWVQLMKNGGKNKVLRL